MKVITVDKSGNEIDLSKVKIPRELQLEVIKVLRGGKNEKNDNRTQTV